MMRRFGIQKVKLCKTNLILRLWIWLIQSNHDKVNKKYSYILQKWPVAYQFRVLQLNLCLPVCSIQGWFIRFCFRNYNSIISFFVHIISLSLSLLDSTLRKKLLNLFFKYTIALLTVLTVIILTAIIQKLNNKIYKICEKNGKHVHTKSVND